MMMVNMLVSWCVWLCYHGD